MATNAIPLPNEDRERLQELIRRLGNDATKAAALAKVHVATLARAVAGLPVQPITATHMRFHVTEALARMPPAVPVTRHG